MLVCEKGRVAGEQSSATITYFLAEKILGTQPTELTFDDVSVEEVLPYPFAGQLRSNAGKATGFVVRPCVVATADNAVL